MVSLRLLVEGIAKLRRRLQLLALARLLLRREVEGLKKGPIVLDADHAAEDDRSPIVRAAPASVTLPLIT